MKRFSLKKKIGAVVAVVAIAAGATAAFAYFTAAGSGTGQAAVGGTGTWGVAQDGAASGNMYPGQGSSDVTFTITNDGSGNQAIESGQLTATILDDSGDITENGVAVSGCSASWFTPSVGTPVPGYGTSIAPAGTVSDTVTVTMTDSGTNQNPCQNRTPDVQLSVAA
jgi:hypothetical protein